MSAGACAASTPGNGREALDDANEALQLEPGSAGAMLVRGAAKAGMGDVAAGLRDLAEAEKRGERSPRFYCEQGLAYLAVKQYDKALRCAERARQINPKEPRVYTLRGQVLGAQKGLAAALEDLHQAVMLDQQSGYGYGVRAEVIAGWDMNLGPMPAEFDTIIKLHPEADPVDLVMGVAPAGNAREAVEKDPDNPRFLRSRWWFTTTWPFARRRCASWTARWRSIRGSSSAHRQRLDIESFIGHYASADVDPQRLIDLTPSSYAGHHGHGVYLVMSGRLEEGLKEISLAIQLAPNWAARDYTVRAMIWLGEGKFSEAVADATCRPGTGLPATRRADASRRGPHAAQPVAEGHRRFRRVGAAPPAYADYWTYLGEARLAMGDAKGAVADFSQALKLSPRLANAIYKRGICRLEMDDLDRAAADFRELLGTAGRGGLLRHGIPRRRRGRLGPRTGAGTAGKVRRGADRI